MGLKRKQLVRLHALYGLKLGSGTYQSIDVASLLSKQ